jgi:aspartyl/asparaginyl-tRNA synthetase
MQNAKYRIQILIFLISLFTIHYSLFTNIAEAAPVILAEELLKEAEKYDGKEVIYKGEVIGDIMIRRDCAWINVRDETGAIGIFCPKELVNEIKYAGSYRFTGDIVSVRGTFHHSCPEHGGDMDIHAERINIIQKGKTISHPLESKKVKASIILPAIAFVLAIVHLVVRRFR